MFSASWTVIPMLLNILLFFMGKEGKMTMAVIYATLIVKGKKTGAPRAYEKLAFGVDQAESLYQFRIVAVINKALSMDPKHAFSVLQARFPEEWGARSAPSKLEISGRDGKPIETKGNLPPIVMLPPEDDE